MEVGNTVTRKQKERVRSQLNRENFRSLIVELSFYATGYRLSTNKCLVAVSKTLKLASITKWMADECVSKVPEMGSLGKLLDIEGHLGWVFDSQGYILYVSSNFQARLNLTGCIVGTHLSKLMPEYKRVLRSVFEDKNDMVCATIKKKSSKITFKPSATPAYLYGKLLSTNHGEDIYIGSIMFYADRAAFFHQSQSFKQSNANFSEVVLDENFDFLKRHKHLDRMQNFFPPLSNFLDCIEPTDLIGVIESFNRMEKQQVNIGFRARKSDSNEFIFVYGQFYRGNTLNGNKIVSGFVSPFTLNSLEEEESLLEMERAPSSERSSSSPEIKRESGYPDYSCWKTNHTDNSIDSGSDTSNEMTQNMFMDCGGLAGNQQLLNDKEVLEALDELFPNMNSPDDGGRRAGQQGSSDEEQEYSEMPRLENTNFWKY